MRLREVGAKRRLNGTSKVNTHTQTHTQTHIWTFRLIESIGPEGRCFENQIQTNQPQKKRFFFTQTNILCLTCTLSILMWQLIDWP